MWHGRPGGRLRWSTVGTGIVKVDFYVQIKLPAIQLFIWIYIINNRIPEETAILTFRKLLEKLVHGKHIFEVDKAQLKYAGMAIKECKMIDAIFDRASQLHQGQDR